MGFRFSQTLFSPVCTLPVLVFLLSLSLGVSPVAAAEFSIALGETSTQTISNGDTVRLRTADDKSYCCQVQSRLATASITWTMVNGLTMGGMDSSIFRGQDGAALNDSNASRICHFQDDAVAPMNPILTYSLGVAGGPAAGAIRCEETTLIGGFNTSVTDFNFLEISAQAKSTSTPAVTGSIIINTVVNPQTTVLPFTIDFSSGTKQRQDISIHDAIGNTKDFGQVTLIHNGANGMVRARISQYRIVTQVPLDFEPVLQEVMTLRTDNW